MKVLIAVLFLFIAGSAFAQSDISIRVAKKQLRKMEREDQKWRNKFVKLSTGKNAGDSVAIKKALTYGHEIDSLHYANLEVIFKKYGYPGYDIVGQLGSLFFWLLVQHQDDHPNFQDSVLTSMKIAVDSGKANGTLYAYLLDRVKVNTGQLQVYGTQTELNSDSSSYQPMPCIDPDHLDDRRKSVGLGPISKYIESINKTYMIKPKYAKVQH